jgi:hypothetical protein
MKKYARAVAEYMICYDMQNLYREVPYDYYMPAIPLVIFYSSIDERPHCIAIYI